tara:strand:- start:202 stop:555 length:354 start_codon:yes stop_codon:yes gene_type:complete
MIPYNNGHIITEVAHAYDMSDYLNDNRKTSYARSGMYWDYNSKFFSTKLELENFYQISEIVEENLSRSQIMAEVIIPIRNDISASFIYEMEDYTKLNNNASSISLSIGWKGNMKWIL